DAVYSVNPSIISNPKEIDILTYQEMRELSYAGFSVFHDEALYPAFKEKIPVCIKNTNNPSADGTMIVANREPDTYNDRSEEHTSELQSRFDLVCRLLLEKKN